MTHSSSGKEAAMKMASTILSEKNASNSSPSQTILPNNSPSYLAGIESSDAVVQVYHQILLKANNLHNDSDSYYIMQEKSISEHLKVIEALNANLVEERRCLESQHYECETQLARAKRKKGVVVSESQKLIEYLSNEMALMDSEEADLDYQHRDVDKRLAEIKSAVDILDGQLDIVTKEHNQLKERELEISKEERELEVRRQFIHQADLQCEEMEKALAQRKDSIDMWVRALEQREKQCNQAQMRTLEQYRALEAGEKELDLDSKHYWRLINPDAPVISQRAIMDNHDMSIEIEDYGKEELCTEDSFEESDEVMLI
eukprot:Tbor_TRINITY_DN5955_c1_g3::TRINITY_DN5955_c1_g3_i1::g.18301::m.18301